MRKKLLVGAVIGGVVLGLWAMFAGVGRETLRGSVNVSWTAEITEA